LAERIVIYNLSSISGYKLFPVARELNEQGHAGPAIVVAQATVELGFERAISMVLEIRDVPGEIAAWIGKTIRRGSWSPVNDRTRQLWEAVTGDQLEELPFWMSYKAGVDLRHAVAHQAHLMIGADDATRFIDDAEALVAHVATVIQGMGDRFPGLGAA
jgi:hypothetical protein